MTKILNGSELAGYIKERQARDVRTLKSTKKITPKLAIVQIKDDPVINTYVRLKKNYGEDIGVLVELHYPKQSNAIDLVNALNKDDSVHGIIIQLPIEDPSETDNIVNVVNANKDVDALAKNSRFEPATATAILWLLAGYNIDLKNKHVVIIGKGKLVGMPLEKMLRKSNINVIVADRKTIDIAKLTINADVIITATGNPSVLSSEMIKPNTVVVDAGVASENGKTVGDLSPNVYERDDLVVTPTRGGVGPLTVCALFENVIKAASSVLV